MWLLSRNIDCRIFQDQTVPQILETIFNDHGFKGLFDIAAPSAQKPREYCVQYRETDLNFVSRLMEEEGLFYFFQHEEKKHTLIVSDGSKQLPSTSPDSLSMLAGDLARRDVENWFAERELHSGAFATAEYNVPDRTVISSTELTSRQIANNAAFEVFDFPSEQFEIADSDRRAMLRMQAEEASAARHSGSTSAPGLAAGHVFELTDHFHAALNDKYMLTTVHHSVTQNFERDGVSTYFNSLSAVRAAGPFRAPLVTPKPIVQGPQTGLVVGKDDRGKIDPAQSDDDIDVDELGRVLVKFFWDRSGPNSKRESQREHESSCRVRVSQNWAGKNWGAAFWPRIGQEVIVEFIEGDPDHPIVTGRLYNGKYKPPYDLPANKTQSGIKTRSTPDGTPDNFNEIRFEDKKGKEEIAIHAERNLSTSVEADESHSVGGKRSTTIKKDDTHVVEQGNYSFDVKTGTTTIHVKGNATENYDADRTITVKGQETHNVDTVLLGMYKTRTVNTFGDDSLTVNGALSIEATGTVTITVGGSTVKVGPATVEVTAGLIKLNC